MTVTAELRHGDCLEVLPELKGKVTLVIADPPFNLGKEFDRKWTDEEYYAWCEALINACFDRLEANGSFFLMTIQRHVGRMMLSLGRLGHFRNMIVWLNSSMPVKDRFCIGYQPILWYVKSLDDYIFNYGVERRVSRAVLPWGRENTAHSIKDIWDDIPFVSGGCMASSEAILLPGTKKKAHPAQMPIRLAERMINYCTKEGDTVLDPCMGIGTTGVACIRTGRNFIGVEEELDSFQRAEQRIAEAYMQPRLEGLQ